MQHARFSIGLIALSMILPANLLATGSFGTFTNQPVTNSLDKSNDQANDADYQADHQSNLLSEQPAASESSQEPKKEQVSLLNSTATSSVKNDAPNIEKRVNNSVEELLQKFMVTYSRKKDLEAAVVADNKASNEYEVAFKKSLKGDNTKQVLLTAMHDIAVKQNGDTKIALALSQAMYDVKTKKRFYKNLTGREQVAVATGVAGTSVVAILIAYRGEIMGVIRACASKIASK